MTTITKIMELYQVDEEQCLDLFKEYHEKEKEMY